MNQNNKSEDRTEKFTDVYNMHYSVIFSVIYSKINNFHETQDICQEVFVRYYKKMEEVENPRKWLFGTMRIVVIDYYKSKNRQNTTGDIDEFLSDAAMSYVNGFKDTRLIIEEALKAIYESEEELNVNIFKLIAIHNYSFTNASKHLNVPYKKLRYRYNKVVKEICDYFKKKGINDLEDLL